jgi:acyl carrier protein
VKQLIGRLPTVRKSCFAEAIVAHNSDVKYTSHVMGLEGVEIIIEIENEFGIAIPDKDVERIMTIGGLAQYVEERLGGSDTLPAQAVCPTSRAFYALRRTMISVLGADRAAIRPSVRLRRLIPYAVRRRFWIEMETAGFRSPPLTVPSGVQLAVIALAGAVGVLLMGGMLKYGWSPTIFVLWIPLSCLIAVYILRRSNSFLPASCVTVGDLARQSWLETVHDGTISQPTITSQSVLDRIKTIVAKELRIPENSIHGETRFSDIVP